MKACSTLLVLILPAAAMAAGGFGVAGVPGIAAVPALTASLAQPSRPGLQPLPIAAENAETPAPGIRLPSPVLDSQLPRFPLDDDFGGQGALLPRPVGPRDPAALALPLPELPSRDRVEAFLAGFFDKRELVLAAR